MDQKSTSPQRQPLKNRSKSTDEVQQAKKAFHIPQKSLPGGSDLLEKVKEGPEEDVTPASSTEELK